MMYTVKKLDGRFKMKTLGFNYRIDYQGFPGPVTETCKQLFGDGVYVSKRSASWYYKPVQVKSTRWAYDIFDDQLACSSVYIKSEKDLLLFQLAV